jgi:hypothetical protein
LGLPNGLPELLQPQVDGLTLLHALSQRAKTTTQRLPVGNKAAVKILRIRQSVGARGMRQTLCLFDEKWTRTPNSATSEIFLGLQADGLEATCSKYTASGVRRSSAL